MKRITREDVRSGLLIVLGCAILAASFAFLTYPNNIVSGGLTGIAQIINLITDLPVGIMVIVMNIPLFAIAWKKMGVRFVVFSFIGMTLCSLFIDLFSAVDLVLTEDMLLASVYGGVTKGLGVGLIYHTGATTGGSDIAARFLRRRFPYINFGTLSLCIDACVVAAFAIIFRRFDSAMYTIITMFVSSRVVNLILYGMATSGVCHVITTQPRPIAQEINLTLGRGATILEGEGAYSGEKRFVVLCVVRRQQVPTLKKIVSTWDEHAFVIVSESHEVFGKNFLNITRID